MPASDPLLETLHIVALALAVLALVSLVSVLVRALHQLHPSDAPTWRGRIAEVVLGIPRGGIGRVRFLGPYGVTVLPARHLEGGSIEPGARVLIVDLDGRVAEVCPYPEGE